MTEQEKIIATAYTGIMFVDDFSRVHEYIEEKLGRPVWTHELAIPGMREKIQNAVKDDFLQMIHEPSKHMSKIKPDMKVKPGVYACIKSIEQPLPVSAAWARYVCKSCGETVLLASDKHPNVSYIVGCPTCGGLMRLSVEEGYDY